MLEPPENQTAKPSISPAAAIVTMIGFAPNAPTANPWTPRPEHRARRQHHRRDDPVLQRPQEQHRGHGHRLAEREREQVPAQDDHRQTGGDDPDEGRRGQDRLQVADAEEAFRGHPAPHTVSSRRRRPGADAASASRFAPGGTNEPRSGGAGGAITDPSARPVTMSASTGGRRPPSGRAPRRCALRTS